jgi:gamma-glutamyltranspeptidase/choline dehydrogenase-like flavoprotein
MPIFESDICIIGGGISAALLSQKLAERTPGVTITIVEAGDTIFDFENRVRYRQRMLDYNENPWPADFIEDQDADGIISRTMAVGGLALHWGGITNRFSQEDLRLKSTYGLAVDWPLSWEELETFYCEAERRIGVAAEPGPYPEDRPSQPYPMAPMELSYNLQQLQGWAEKSGSRFWATPCAKNTVEYDGRSPCLRCTTCAICPTGARYSPDFTFKRLLKEKKIVLHDKTLVRRLVVDEGRGGAKIAAAQAVHRERPEQAIEYRAKLFVVAAGYTWSSHLLLLSSSTRFPNGIANSSGLVGRYMTGHAFVSAQVEMDVKQYPGMNEPHSLITREFFRCRADRPFIRHDFRIWESAAGREPRLRDESGALLLGDALLRDWRTRATRGAARLRAYYDVHPSEHSSLTLDPQKKNRWGDPLPKIEHRLDEASVAREEATRRQILDRFGALAKADNGKIVSTEFGTYLDHPSGGCRMGTDPATSVCDSYGRTHDHDNLFIVGAPTQPTGGCTNATLTFAALTLRSAEQIAESLKPRAIAALVCALAILGGVARTSHAQDLGDAAGHARVQVQAHRPPVPGVSGLVTSAHPLASAAGLQILLKGGNAIDAAIAVAATLNVVEPSSSGIAGNGFATVFDKKSGKVYSLSMAGAAPKAMKAEAVTPDELDRGIKAAAVPGHLGGLIAALDRFGTRSLADVLEPAIGYAERGHPANASLVSGVAGQRAFFGKTPTSAKVFLPDGRVPAVGEMVKNVDLAATFRKLVEAEQQALKQGKSRSQALQAAADRFYRGDIAQEFARFFAANGGLLSAEDLAAYRPQWTEPVHTTYRGYDVYSNPSTSRGGIEVLMQLNLIEGFDLKALGHNSPATLHLIAETIKLAKADVYRYVADPKFADVPTAGLLSKEYAAERRKLIDPDKAMAYPAAGDPSTAAAGRSRSARAAGFGAGGAGRAAGSAELAMARRSTASAVASARGPRFPEDYEDDPETTSFSIVDREGNAVAMTPTLGGFFGTAVVAGNTGLLFNNGMRLGSTSPYPESVNYVRGGQVPVLNNSPLIVMKNGQLVLAIGTPGGETIGQTQFQGLLNVLDFGLNIQEAVEAPRMRVDPKPNFYKPGASMTIAIEARVPTAVVTALRALGHTVELLPDYTAGVGGMQGILIDEATRTMTAGADPRRAGYAIGW